MNYCLIIFSFFLIDITLLKCSEQAPFYETVIRYYGTIDQIRQTSLKTINAFNQKYPTLALKQQPHDRDAHFVFESTHRTNPYQLKIRPHEHFKDFQVTLKQANKPKFTRIVALDNLSTLPEIIITMLLQTSHP